MNRVFYPIPLHLVFYSLSENTKVITKYDMYRIIKMGNQFFLLTAPEYDRRSIWRLEAYDLSVDEASNLLVNIYNTVE